MDKSAQRSRVDLTPDVTSGSSVYVIILCCVAAIGGFLFGFDSGAINGAVDAFGAGRVADFVGRRPAMLFNAVLFFVSAVATGAANSAGLFIVARIAGGIAIGAASVLAPMYIAEVAPARIRGRLATLQQLAIVLGLFGAFLSNDVIAKLAGGAGAIFWMGKPAWRWMFWTEALPAAAFLVGTLLIPESPRFLIFRGKHERARNIFARIGGNADRLVREIEQSLEGQH